MLSGAGLSVTEPSRAPLGNDLRNAYLDALLAMATTSPWKNLAELEGVDDVWGQGLKDWKLETLVGMVADVVLNRAYAPLRLVVEGAPNRGHELAAELMESGRAPIHLTLNFDDFVERAYETLTGQLPEVLTPDDADRLVWLSSTDWRNLDRPVVVHLHGRVVEADGDWTYPGLVVTLERIQGPAPVWLLPLLSEALRGDLVVTGYSGLDTDVWPTLLFAAAETQGTTRIWNDVRPLGRAVEVRRALEVQAFEFTGGGAVSALAGALGRVESSLGSRGTFAAERVPELLDLEPPEATVLLAWILEDVGGAGRAWALRLLEGGPPDVATADVVWRWWMKMGTVRRDGGKHAEGLPYLREARRMAPRAGGTRASLRLDEADCYRHFLRTREGLHRLDALVRFEISLWAATVLSLGTSGRPAVRQRSPRIRAHTLLRVLDARSSLPAIARRLIARRAVRLLRRSVRGPNAHTTMFAYLQLAEAISHAALSGSKESAAEARRALVDARRRADFIRQPLGRANTMCAAGLVEIAFGDPNEARVLLIDADRIYAAAGHQSGRDLVAWRLELLP